MLGFGQRRRVPPPPTAPKTVAHPSGPHIGWWRPPCAASCAPRYRKWCYHQRYSQPRLDKPQQFPRDLRSNALPVLRLHILLPVKAIPYGALKLGVYEAYEILLGSALASWGLSKFAKSMICGACSGVTTGAFNCRAISSCLQKQCKRVSLMFQGLQMRQEATHRRKKTIVASICIQLLAHMHQET